MARLIDADKLKTKIKYSLNTIKNETLLRTEYLINQETVLHVIDTQPEYNPWRKIDDVDGLEKYQALIVRSDAGMSFGTFSNGKVLPVMLGMDKATQYMVIPEPPKVEK